MATQLKPHEIIRTRLREELNKRGMSATDLAREAGVKTSFIYDILNGKSTNPSVITLAQVAATLELELSALSGEAASRSQRSGAEYFTPLFLAANSKGATSSAKECGLQFSRRWLKQRFSAVESLRLFEVPDDSMAPTLERGDLLLVDTARTDPSPPGKFLLFNGYGLEVKRLEPAGGKRAATVRVFSDNPRYDRPQDVPVTSLNIVGRIVWKARSV